MPALKLFAFYLNKMYPPFSNSNFPQILYDVKGALIASNLDICQIKFRFSKQQFVLIIALGFNVYLSNVKVED